MSNRALSSREARRKAHFIWLSSWDDMVRPCLRGSVGDSTAVIPAAGLREDLYPVRTRGGGQSAEEKAKLGRAAKD